MQVFHWRPTLQLYIYVRLAGKVEGGDKNPQKRREFFGSASTHQRDVKHTGLSGSRGPTCSGVGMFCTDWSGNYQDKLLSPNRQALNPNRQAVAGPDKPYCQTDRPVETYRTP